MTGLYIQLTQYFVSRSEIFREKKFQLWESNIFQILWTQKHCRKKTTKTKQVSPNKTAKHYKPQSMSVWSICWGQCSTEPHSKCREQVSPMVPMVLFSQIASHQATVQFFLDSTVPLDQCRLGSGASHHMYSIVLTRRLTTHWCSWYRKNALCTVQRCINI